MNSMHPSPRQLLLPCASYESYESYESFWQLERGRRTSRFLKDDLKDKGSLASSSAPRPQPKGRRHSDGRPIHANHGGGIYLDPVRSERLEPASCAALSRPSAAWEARTSSPPPCHRRRGRLEYPAARAAQLPRPRGAWEARISSRPQAAHSLGAAAQCCKAEAGHAHPSHRSLPCYESCESLPPQLALL